MASWGICSAWALFLCPILSRVDAFTALCDKLEAALAAADTTRNRLLTALLHEALAPATTPAELETAA
jgi:type I restriction enzyme S subunit